MTTTATLITASRDPVAPGRLRLHWARPYIICLSVAQESPDGWQRWQGGRCYPSLEALVQAVALEWGIYDYRLEVQA